MTKSCRLCLQQCYEFLELFSKKGLVEDIPGIISKHLWFEPCRDDKYSQLICVKCWNCLKSFHDFYQSIQNAQNLLHNQLKQTIDVTPDINFKEESFVDVNSEYFSNGKDFKEEPEGLSDSKEISEDEITYDDIPKEETESDSDESSSSDRPIIKRKKERSRKIKLLNSNKKIENNETVQNSKREHKPLNQNNSIPTTSRALLRKQNAERKYQHREEENKRIIEFYKLDCEICQMKFATFSDLRNHYEKIHSMRNGYVICCKKKLKSQSSLLEHLEWHLDPNKFCCSICGKFYKGKKYLRVHMSSHRQLMKTLYCDNCGKAYETKRKLIQHLKTAHLPDENKTHECNQCGKRFHIKSILMAHIRRVHELYDKSVCDICAKVFRSRNQCKIHIQNQHSEEKLSKVQCTICGSWLKNEIVLKHHIRRSHYSAVGTCETCGKTAPNKEALRNHIMYVHILKPIHKCNYCDKSFKKPVALKEHEASHTGAILYNCPYCPKTFNSKANMWAHRKHKHTEDWLRDRNSKNGPTS